MCDFCIGNKQVDETFIYYSPIYHVNIPVNLCNRCIDTINTKYGSIAAFVESGDKMKHRGIMGRQKRG